MAILCLVASLGPGPVCESPFCGRCHLGVIWVRAGCVCVGVSVSLCGGHIWEGGGCVSVGGECRAVARVSLCVYLSVGQFWEWIVVCVSGFGGALVCVCVGFAGLWSVQVGGLCC